MCQKHFPLFIPFESPHLKAQAPQFAPTLPVQSISQRPKHTKVSCSRRTRRCSRRGGHVHVRTYTYRRKLACTQIRKQITGKQTKRAVGTALSRTLS
jgi:hypothetical protein